MEAGHGFITGKRAMRVALAAGAAFVSGLAGIAVVVFALSAVNWHHDDGAAMLLILAGFFVPTVVVAAAVLRQGEPASVAHDPPLADIMPAAQIDAILAQAKAPPPKVKQSASVLVLVSLVVFVLLAGREQTAEHLVLLVLVLLFHEAGHIAGMHVFGYSDLRVLFVPFVGALASGRKEDAPAWQRGVVLLLGPLPGLVLSGVLLVLANEGITRALALQLLVINGLNLMPLYPLDGGCFVQQLFASRPRLQVALSAVGLVGLALLGALGHMRILVAIAAFFLVGIPIQLRLAKESSAMRAAAGPVPALANLSDEALRDLCARAVRSSRVRPPRPPTIVNFMRQIHDRARIEPMNAVTAVGLVAAYAGGFFLVAVDLVLLGRAR
jgi:hypothetical protein